MLIAKTKLENGKVLKLTLGRELNTAKETATGATELDIETQARFIDGVSKVFEDGAEKVIIDLNNVNYIDSSGLWALFESHKKATFKNAKLVLLKPSKDIKRVLDITKMSSKLLTFEAEKDAVKFLLNDKES